MPHRRSTRRPIPLGAEIDAPSTPNHAQPRAPATPRRPVRSARPHHAEMVTRLPAELPRNDYELQLRCNSGLLKVLFAFAVVCLIVPFVYITWMLGTEPGGTSENHAQACRRYVVLFLEIAVNCG